MTEFFSSSGLSDLIMYRARYNSDILKKSRVMLSLLFNMVE